MAIEWNTDNNGEGVRVFVAVDDTRQNLLVTNSSFEDIFLIDAVDGSTITSSNVAPDPRGAAYHEGEDAYYVGQGNVTDFLKIDAGNISNVLESRSMPSFSGTIDCGPQSDTIAVGAAGDNTVYGLDKDDLSTKWTRSSSRNPLVCYDRARDLVGTVVNDNFYILDAENGTTEASMTDYSVGGSDIAGHDGAYIAVGPNEISSFFDIDSGNDVQINSINDSTIEYDLEVNKFLTGSFNYVNRDGQFDGDAGVSASSQDTGISYSFDKVRYNYIESQTLFQFATQEFVGTEISGVVSDTFGNGLVATISIKNGSDQTTSSSDGSYSIYQQDGAYTLVASKSGYSSQEQDVIVDGQAETANFTLEELVEIVVNVADINTGVPLANIPISFEETDYSGSTANTDTSGSATVNVGVSLRETIMKIAEGQTDRRYSEASVLVDTKDGDQIKDVELERKQNIGTSN